MRPLLKWILITVITLIVGLTTAYFYLAGFGRQSLDLSNNPREPKFEIPNTYSIGWWTNQDSLKIDSLKVIIIESHLNLFTAKSLISYSVTGHIGYRSYWLPSISEVHLSERLNKDTSFPFDRIIEITPVVKVEQVKKKGGTAFFHFTNEMTINSNHWGNNRIKLICLDKEQIIELHQYK